MARATDEEIIAFARSLNAVVVTLDADFHALLAVGKATEPSTIRIRMEGLSVADVADVIERVVAAASDDLQAGCAVSVNPLGIRVRRLPLV